jgi:hypothetical protein
MLVSHAAAGHRSQICAGSAEDAPKGTANLAQRRWQTAHAERASEHDLNVCEPSS